MIELDDRGNDARDVHDDELVAELCRRAFNSDRPVESVIDEGIRQLAPLRSASDQQRLTRRAVARLTGLGALDELLADPTVDEVLVNASSELWVDRGGTVAAVGRLRDQPVDHLVERILAPIGRRVDQTSPIVDARLPDGSRVCAVLPPVAVDGTVLSIRKFARVPRLLDEFTDDVGDALVREIVEARCNVIVSGSTSSGKSSFLSALLEATPPSQRIVIVEDTAELVVARSNAVRLEARPPANDGPPPISLADLVRTSLRLRPDRIAVGEVRGDEVIGLLQAMNTGHDGSLCTCHANSASDALLRLEGLTLQAAPTWPLEAIREQLRRSLDVVVHLVRDPTTGRRSIESIVEICLPPDLAPSGGPLTTRVLAEADSMRTLHQRAELIRRRGDRTHHGDS